MTLNEKLIVNGQCNGALQMLISDIEDLYSGLLAKRKDGYGLTEKQEGQWDLINRLRMDYQHLR